MKNERFLTAAAWIVWLGYAGATLAEPAANSVPVLRRYANYFKLDGRKEKIPDEFIADDGRWAEVWQILHGEMERPKVDFTKEVVLVGIFGDENRFSIETSLNEHGDLRMGTLGTLVGYVNPTTGNYVLNVISREGIKTINGRPLRNDIGREATDGDSRAGGGVAILRRYTGKYPLSKLDDRISDTVITDERRWGEVWQILCGNRERPDVDFRNEIVLVAINRDENYISGEPLLKGDGDLQVRNWVTLMLSQHPVEGTYSFSVISRRGIKTVEGQRLRRGIWRATTDSVFPRSGVILR